MIPHSGKVKPWEGRPKTASLMASGIGDTEDTEKLYQTWLVVSTHLKNMNVKLDHFPKVRYENKKCLSCHHLETNPPPMLNVHTLDLALVSFQKKYHFYILPKTPGSNGVPPLVMLKRVAKTHIFLGFFITTQQGNCWGPITIFHQFKGTIFRAWKAFCALFSRQ